MGATKVAEKINIHPYSFELLNQISYNRRLIFPNSPAEHCPIWDYFFECRLQLGESISTLNMPICRRKLLNFKLF